MTWIDLVWILFAQDTYWDATVLIMYATWLDLYCAPLELAGILRLADINRLQHFKVFWSIKMFGINSQNGNLILVPV